MNTYEQLKEKLENVLAVNKAINDENRRMDRMTIKLKKEVELLRCCGNCRYYKSHECYFFHNWEAYKKCDGEGKHKWKFAHR